MSSVPEPSIPPWTRGFLGVVACGGASRRMGADKARVEVAGEPLYARAARGLAVLCDTVVLASGPRPLGDPRWADLADAPIAGGEGAPSERGGPLAALVAALEHASLGGFRGVVFVACDLPGLDLDAVAPLRAVVQRGEAAVAHWTRDGVDEPLCTAVGVEALGALRDALRAGERRPARAFEALLRWRAEVPAALGARLTNVNTPEDLAAWLSDPRGAVHRVGPDAANPVAVREARIHGQGCCEGAA